MFQLKCIIHNNFFTFSDIKYSNVSFLKELAILLTFFVFEEKRKLCVCRGSPIANHLSLELFFPLFSLSNTVFRVLNINSGKTVERVEGKLMKEEVIFLCI